MDQIRKGKRRKQYSRLTIELSHGGRSLSELLAERQKAGRSLRSIALEFGVGHQTLIRLRDRMRAEEQETAQVG